MNLACELVQALEYTDSSLSTLHLITENKKTNKTTNHEHLFQKVIKQSSPDELNHHQIMAHAIERHPLYIHPASEASESYYFGWNRGAALKLETLIRGRWFSWLRIIEKGTLKEDDNIPSCSLVSGVETTLVRKMLDKCMAYAQQEGHRVSDFLEWIGYSLGISWFIKPKISPRLWEKWYQSFDLSLMLLYPYDHLSHFLSEYGQSGLSGYYPTPIGISSLMNQLIGWDHDRTISTYEPCLGTGAMLIPSSSFCLVGTDINPIMAKASAIQAFLYLPWLLYVSTPIIGLHFSEKEMRMDKYFEFDTNTRIYLGNSLLGEFTAPQDVFNMATDHIDVYLHPLDLSKRDVFQFEEEMLKPWISLSNATKFKIIAAQSREIGFELILSNPPFGKLNRYTLEKTKEIEGKNKGFLADRKKRLELLEQEQHPLLNDIEEEVQVKLNEIGQYELMLD